MQKGEHERTTQHNTNSDDFVDRSSITNRLQHCSVRWWPMPDVWASTWRHTQALIAAVTLSFFKFLFHLIAGALLRSADHTLCPNEEIKKKYYTASNNNKRARETEENWFNTPKKKTVSSETRNNLRREIEMRAAERVKLVHVRGWTSSRTLMIKLFSAFFFWV